MKIVKMKLMKEEKGKVEKGIKLNYKLGGRRIV